MLTSFTIQWVEGMSEYIAVRYLKRVWISVASLDKREPNIRFPGRYFYKVDVCCALPFAECFGEGAMYISFGKAIIVIVFDSPSNNLQIDNEYINRNEARLLAYIFTFLFQP